MTSKLQFCPNCDYYLYLDGKKNELLRICRNCGYRKTNDNGLVMETDLQEKSSEGYKVILNEFTRFDPTLPHLHNIKCPNNECKSNEEIGRGAGGAGAGAIESKNDTGNETEGEKKTETPVLNTSLNNIKSDIIYLKYDNENMKYVYICNYCQTTWKSS